MVVDATVDLLRRAVIDLPPDVEAALALAIEWEESEVACAQLQVILENIKVARKTSTPMCQDTGIPIFFVELGRNAQLDFDIEEAIREGVRRATQEVPLRPNAVHPFTRSNSGDNTGPGIPDITIELTDGDEITITAAPKGAGSENMSALWMFMPAELPTIKQRIVERVKDAGGMPCPPTIIGIGIGGSFDKSARLAKKALLRPLDEEPTELEREILDAINSLGIGPMGLGGKTTALAVKVETAYCHTASLPVAMNVQCWAARRATTTLR